MHRIMYGLALAITAILATGAVAQTPVEGPQSGIWTLAGSPYQTTGGITVAPGSTLTIEAGVEVLFDAYSAIGVEGSIHAQGTDGSPVVFAPGTSPDWNGIQISGGDSSSFTYTNISGSVRGDEASMANGGALFVTGDGTRVTVTSCSLTDNSVDGAGGAISAEEGAWVSISDSEFLRNNADGEAADGGGAVFVAYYAFASIAECSFSGNSSGGRGGAVRVRDFARAEIADCDIRNNHGWHGGGISVHEAEGLVARTFIVDNDAVSGGGGVHGYNASSLVLENVTVAGNISSWAGGVGVSGTVNVISSIVWDNAPSIGTSAPTPVEYSDWQRGGDVWPGEGNIYADPLFADPAGGNYALLPGSPCIDAGSPYGALDADGSRADMGATGGDGADQSLPRIALPPYIVIGEGQSTNLPVQNTGESALTIDATISGPFSTAAEFPMEIQPGGEALIPVTFDGTGDVGGVVEISHDDPHRPTPQVVDVHGVTGEVVSGEVSGGWSAANGVHHVTGPIVIPAEQALTIEPGVEVVFDADVEFLIYGSLQAIGHVEGGDIMFHPGLAASWGGLRFAGGSSTLEYVEVTGAQVGGQVSHWQEAGGGIAVYSPGTELTIRNSRIHDNNASSYGGAVIVQDGAFLLAEDTWFWGNSAWQCAAVDITNSDAVFERCVFVGNHSFGSKPGITVWQSGTTQIRNSLITDSHFSGEQPDGPLGALYIYGGAALHVESSIVWGNEGDETIVFDGDLSGTLMASHSIVEGGWNGPGVIDADPMWVAPVEWGFELMSGSPAIDNGSPLSPPDADGTQSDMGPLPAFHTVTPELAIADVQTIPDRTVHVPVIATITEAYNLDIAILFDPTLVFPSENAIAWSVVDGQPNALASSNVVGDTLFVTIANNVPFTLTGNAALALNFDTDVDAPISSSTGLVWVPEFTNYNDMTPPLTDGSIMFESILFGDVSADGEVTSYDASLILQYVVHVVREIDFARADVTGNAEVTGYDAAWVLRKIVDPGLVLPIEMPVFKPGGFAPVTLTWQRDGNIWALIASDAAGVLGGELAVRAPTASNASVTGPGMVVSGRSDDLINIGFARPNESSAEIVRIAGLGDTPPEIVAASLNEGAIPVVEPRPLVFELEQNVPNPFNPTTSLRFSVPEAGAASLSIWSATGQHVRTLVDADLAAGTHEVVWDGRDASGRNAASGVYIARLTVTGESQATSNDVKLRRLTLVR